MTPTWMFSDHLDMDTNNAVGWLHIPLEVVHPWFVPRDLAGHGALFHQTGPYETILHSGIKNGVFITNQQLSLLHGHLKFPLEKKTGRVPKKDMVNALLNFLFPDEPLASKQKMAAGLLGRQWKHLDSKHATKHTSDIIQAFQGLPQEDMQEFSQLCAVAVDEKLLQEKRDQKPRIETSRKRKEHITPKKLRDLHPQVPGCSIRRHPVLKRYQVFYTIYNAAGASTRFI